MNKTIVLGIFVFVSAALGGMLIRGKQYDAQMSARVAELKVQVAAQQNEIQQTKAAAAALEQKTAQFAAKAKAARQSLVEARAAAASAGSDPAAATPAPASSDAAAPGTKKKPANPFTDSIAKMMKDPAMKDMMRTTQSAAIQQMYGDLVKQWALPPDETKTFYDLLLDKQMAQMDQGLSLMEKGPDAAQTASPGDMDAKIKASLGDDLYKQYQDYEKTIPAHMAVNQLQQQLAVSNAQAMTADQSKVLLQAITEEQAAAPNASMVSPMGTGSASFMTDPAKMDQYYQAQSDTNDKIAARMANTLTAEQLQVLKQEQQQMLSMQRMGMQMAAKMMAPSPTP